MFESMELARESTGVIRSFVRKSIEKRYRVDQGGKEEEEGREGGDEMEVEG